jgi:hypothetical protein
VGRDFDEHVDGTIHAFAVRQHALRSPLDEPDTIGRELARMLAAYLTSKRSS